MSKVQGTTWMEEEANLFAMLLLIPRQLLEPELKNRKIDLGSNDAYSDLAKMFDVPLNAMIKRIEIFHLHNI